MSRELDGELYRVDYGIGDADKKSTKMGQRKRKQKAVVSRPTRAQSIFLKSSRYCTVFQVEAGRSSPSAAAPLHPAQADGSGPRLGSQAMKGPSILTGGGRSRAFYFFFSSATHSRSLIPLHIPLLPTKNQ